MAGRTFSAISSGTLTRTVSPLFCVSTTRTCSQRSELFEEFEVTVTLWPDRMTGESNTAAARATHARRAVPSKTRLIKLLLEDSYGAGQPVPNDAEPHRFDNGCQRY